MLEKTEVDKTAVNGFAGIPKPILDLPCVRRMLLKNKKEIWILLLELRIC